MSETELTRYIGKIGKIFDIASITGQCIDKKDIVDYYTQSDYGYKVFHSVDGSIHMALNFDGEFSKSGYYGQAKIVQGYIDQLCPKHVLELACGNGFNCTYLAERNMAVNFVGLDITPLHIETAKKRASGLENVAFEVGDFQALSFETASVDIVFVVESLCHATDMTLALEEAYRVLKPGGVFIVIDGFRKPGFCYLSKDVRTAARLVEVTMAVGHPMEIDDWLSITRNAGFRVLKEEDITKAIVPNLEKFQFLARGYFKFPLLSKALFKVFPPYLIKNSIAGLLMPLTIKANAQGYFVVALARD